MDRPVVRLLVADGGGDGHLRHDRRATATHKTLVEKNHRRARRAAATAAYIPAPPAPTISTSVVRRGIIPRWRSELRIAILIPSET